MMKLSGSQLVWIIVTEVVAIIWINITPAVLISKQDSWISILVAGCIGAALTFLVVHLSMLHPHQTLAQFSRALLGKWLGRLIVLPYLFAWYTLSAYLLRGFPDFLKPILIDRTPLWIIMLLLLGLMVYLPYSTGITGIGRFCEIVGPIMVFVLVISFIINAGNANWHHLLPVYADTGWENIVKVSIRPAYWFAGPFTLLVIVAFMKNPRKALQKSMIGIGITVVMAVTATLMVLMIFGPNLAAKIRFSYFIYVRTIDILDFVQNLDIFVIFIWVFGVTAQLSLYLFVATYETAQLFQVKNWRKIIWFSIPGIFIMAILIPDETIIAAYDKLWVSVIFPVCGIGIPLLLWLVTVIKRKLAY
ncbi:MAG: spore germination protein [Paenibacillaceae bacterium]|jgi:spore germination protein KB|nr:spore germination protein [Paenibacillaceae bacterium]